MTSSARRTTNQSTIRASMYTGNSIKAHSLLSKKLEDERRSLRVPVRLVDEFGVDYTPLPLLSDEKKVKDGDKDTPSDNYSQGSAYTQSISSFIATNPMAITRSKSQQSSSGYTAESSSTTSDEVVEGTSLGLKGYTEIKTVKTEGPTPIKPSELDKIVNIVLEETDTMFIFDMEPKAFQIESEYSTTIEKRNKEYEALRNSRAGNDKYVERGMNTFENASISKIVQTERIGHNDVGNMATIWDIHDKFLDLANQEQAEKGDATKDDNMEISSPNTTGVDDKQKTFSSEGMGKVVSNPPSPDLQASKSIAAGSRTPTAMDKTQESVSAHSESDLFGTRQSTATPSSSHDSQAKIEEILNSDKLAYSLFVMERALNMNQYFEKMLYYRNLPYYEELMQKLKVPVTPVPKEFEQEEEQTTETEQDKDKIKPIASSKIGEGSELSKSSFFLSAHPLMESLWKFQIPMTKGRNISCLAWNKQNQDILAVAYGQYEYTNQKAGLVCCWSLKNIDYPERIYNVPYGATAVSWSKAHSNLLAVGMFDGTISVFDVRKKINEPVVETKYASGRHIGPIRQLEWIIRVSGRSEEHSEMLVSISSDGRVTQWSIRKGFESSATDYHHDLMKLKRIATKIPIASKQKKTDAIISQYAVGSCFDFNPEDSNIYLAGVEEGHIHKCSCSYNEQYLENFFGHTAAVYSVKWSPFVSDIFLSCSADWTIKLWHVERKLSVLSIQSSVRAVNSVVWSPKSSVIFACINESAIEIWDLRHSTLDPLIVESAFPDSIVLTTITFTDTGDCLIVGDSDGTLYIYTLKNLPTLPKNQAEALDKTIQSCIASQLQK